MGRFDDKVVFISGGARGQGRSHAVRFAEEGADIVLMDACTDFPSVPYGLGTSVELKETVELVEATGRRVVASEGDVRRLADVEAAVAAGIAEFGRIDVVLPNAGVVSYGTVADLTEDQWRDVVDINLTGVWHTVKATIPYLGEGSSIILTSSVAGLKGIQNIGHYTATKHAVVGLMRSLVNELGPARIRVNAVAPTSVDTGMIQNTANRRLFRPDLEDPTVEQVAEVSAGNHPFPEPWTEAEDITNAMLFLASEDARHITGAVLPIDLGELAK